MSTSSPSLPSNNQSLLKGVVPFKAEMKEAFLALFPGGEAGAAFVNGVEGVGEVRKAISAYLSGNKPEAMKDGLAAVGDFGTAAVRAHMSDKSLGQRMVEGTLLEVAENVLPKVAGNLFADSHRSTPPTPSLGGTPGIIPQH